MIVPIGLGHKYIKTPWLTWLTAISMGAFIYKAHLSIPFSFGVLLNLIFLIVLGPYLEFRVSRSVLLIGILFSTLFSSLVFGSLFKSSNYLLNHTHTVSWIFGLYLVLFSQKNFKLGIWRILNWKVINILTPKILPSIFVIYWWGGLFISGSNTKNIFHNLLPVLFFALGNIVGSLYKRSSPIPANYLYVFEWKKWERILKKKSDIKKMYYFAKAIFEFNSENHKVRFDICKKLLKEVRDNETLEKDIYLFFIVHFNKLLSHFVKTKKLDSGLEMLSTIPIETNFQKIILKISGGNLLEYGNLAIKKHFNVLAISLYCSFLEKNFKSSKSSAIMKSLDLLIESEMELNESVATLQYIESILTQQEVKHLFKQHFQFSKTAVVASAAVNKKVS